VVGGALSVPSRFSVAGLSVVKPPASSSVVVVTSVDPRETVCVVTAVTVTSGSTGSPEPEPEPLKSPPLSSSVVAPTVVSGDGGGGGGGSGPAVDCSVEPEPPPLPERSSVKRVSTVVDAVRAVVAVLGGLSSGSGSNNTPDPSLPVRFAPSRSSDTVDTMVGVVADAVDCVGDCHGVMGTPSPLPLSPEASPLLNSSSTFSVGMLATAVASDAVGMGAPVDMGPTSTVECPPVKSSRGSLPLSLSSGLSSSSTMAPAVTPAGVVAALWAGVASKVKMSGCDALGVATSCEVPSVGTVVSSSVTGVSVSSSNPLCDGVVTATVAADK